MTKRMTLSGKEVRVVGKKAKKRREAKVKPVTKPKPLFKLDLACGMRKHDGFLGVDKEKLDGAVDIVYDLEQFPWPWQSDSVDEVICNHYVEHVQDMIKFMDELYRVLKPGAKATLLAPYYNSMRAWQDPTHKRAISESTFLYFNKGWRESNKIDHEVKIKSDFDFSYGYLCTPDWAARNEEARNFAIRHYTNVVNDIQVVLVKRDPNAKVA